MQQDLLLYSFRRCPFALRVRIVLHEKGLPFTVKEEDLKKFSDELKALHPEVKVPLLVHGTNVIYESSVITEYLDDAFPNAHSLMPSTAFYRAEARLWTHWCNQLFKPDVDRLKYGKSRFPEEACHGIEAKIRGHLAKLEARLKVFPWLVGDTYTLGDIHVFPFVRQLLRVSPSPDFLQDYPATMAWADRIQGRDSFQKAIKA